MPAIYSYAILYYPNLTVDLYRTAVDHRRLARLLLHDLGRFCMVRAHRRAVSTVISAEAPLLGRLTAGDFECIIVCIHTMHRPTTMTLPDERYWALIKTEQFLMQLQDPKITPRVPRYIRDQAGSLLRHYPGTYYIEEIARKSPEILSPEIEPLHRMILAHDQQQQEDDSRGRSPQC